MTDDGVQGGKDPLSTSTTLLGRVRGLDPEAWPRLVDLYGPLIYHWCRRGGLQDADAADVGQDVFRAVARTIGVFRHGATGDTFRGWLKVITRNKIRDFARRKRPGGEGVGGSDAQTALAGMAAPADDADGAAEATETRMLLRRALDLTLAEFKEESREAFLRVACGGRDPAEVARELGTTVNAVYLAKSRIKRPLREEFAGLIDL